MLNKEIIQSYFTRVKNNSYLRGSLSFVGILILAFVFYNLLFAGRVYPNTYVAGIEVSRKSKAEVQELLSKNVIPPEKLVIKNGNQTFDIDLSTIDFEYDFEETADAAISLHRTGNIVFDLARRVKSLYSRTNIGLRLKLNEEKLEENLSVIAGQATVEPVYPGASYTNGSIVVDKGKAGQDIDKERLRLKIGKSLSNLKKEPIELSLVEVDPTLTNEEAEAFRKRAENLVGKRLSLRFEFQEFNYRVNDLLSLLDPQGQYLEDEVVKLAEDIKDEVDRDPQNPAFQYEGGVVKEFAPAKEGVSVDKDALKERIIGNLRTLESTDEKIASIDIPADKTPPDIQTGEVNDLGINELLGRGSSKFAGSIPSRIYNIDLASSKFHGVLVKPGEVFSFNQVLGDVSAYTGYKQAYIIKDGKTVLGDGGGVCQVSTTFFRAILDAGLPVVERNPHSYRVGYYEQDSAPGFDATIYTPYVDLKFRNDTPSHLLIQRVYNPTTASLAFEIYGTDDGRVATTTNPVVSNVTSPPPPKYEEDPSLPEGTVKQIEYSANGANVHFTYTIKKNGEITYQKTFYSNYRPWQAVYLQGTGPAN